MKRNYIILLSFVCSLFWATSCEDYLSIPPEKNLDKNEVFQDFNNAQGYVEEMYAFVVDYGTGGFWQTNISYGEDIMGHGTFNTSVDQGLYRAWNPNDGSIFGSPKELKSNADLAFNRHRIWQSSWKGIRKANMVIENAEALMINATPLQKQAILGQAYFFRGFFHHELMKYWGALPFIDQVLDPGDEFKIPRPKTWEETALKVNEDLKKAADLLPLHWDDWGGPGEPGNKTMGKNMFRITKGAALSILAKNYLFMASPLMSGGKGTYDYNVEYARQAVKYFAEVINLKDINGAPRYSLQPWETYENVFYTLGTGYPGGSEYIFSQAGGENWVHGFLADMFQMKSHSSENALLSPTHNYIHNYFGMVDGLTCDDSPLYDPNNPWRNREPRFGKWIVVDGDPLIKNIGAATGNDEKHRFAQFYTTGVHRYPNNTMGTKTGYLCRKWLGLEHNNWDKKKVTPFSLHVRFTDVVLMYAEAALVAYGIDNPNEFSDLTALGAINMLRDRASAPRVHSNYLVSTQKFMDEIRRERACEMAWEPCRWMDVRRWRLGTEMKYKLKTELVFERNAQGKAVNFKEQVLLTKVFDEKHYWLPFLEDDVKLYPEFGQNPGW